jgi:hypothetical protein
MGVLGDSVFLLEPSICLICELYYFIVEKRNASRGIIRHHVDGGFDGLGIRRRGERSECKQAN